ncbi:MAG TPA: translocation/assembly module TamB domain-containing protein, partial [Chroococcales cyanobacterium]
NGRIQIENYLPKALDLHLHSKPFKLRLENGLYDGVVETNVHLTGSVEEPVASGLILLSRGVINIKTPEKGQKEAGLPLALSDLTVSLGSGVSLKSEPLIDLNLQGAMLVNGTLAEPIPRGIIKIRGGTIMSLTNAFSVSEGKVEFNGTPENSSFNKISASTNAMDAAVEIKAKARVYDYKNDPSNPNKYYNVTANVSGSLLNMKLDFESDPPLSQEQILDILGKKELIVQTLNRQITGSEVLTREGSDWLNNLLTRNMVKPITNRMEDLFPIFDDLGFDLVSDSTKQEELALSGLNLSLYAETKPIFGNLTLSYRHQFRNQNRNYFRAGVNYRLNRSLGLQLSLEPNDSPDAGALSPEQKMGLNSALQLTTQYRF